MRSERYVVGDVSCMALQITEETGFSLREMESHCRSEMIGLHFKRITLAALGE